MSSFTSHLRTFKDKCIKSLSRVKSFLSFRLSEEDKKAAYTVALTAASLTAALALFIHYSVGPSTFHSRDTYLSTSWGCEKDLPIEPYRPLWDCYDTHCFNFTDHYYRKDRQLCLLTYQLDINYLEGVIYRTTFYLTERTATAVLYLLEAPSRFLYRILLAKYHAAELHDAEHISFCLSQTDKYTSCSTDLGIMGNHVSNNIANNGDLEAFHWHGPSLLVMFGGMAFIIAAVTTTACCIHRRHKHAARQHTLRAAEEAIRLHASSMPMPMPTVRALEAPSAPPYFPKLSSMAQM